jgi:hypothetical protein
MDGNRNGSMAQKYGISQPNFSAIDGMHQYSGDSTVNPYTSESRTTVGKQMSWRGNLGAQSGQGTFLKFGDSSAPSMPPSAGA